MDHTIRGVGIDMVASRDTLDLYHCQSRATQQYTSIIEGDFSAKTKTNVSAGSQICRYTTDWVQLTYNGTVKSRTLRDGYLYVKEIGTIEEDDTSVYWTRKLVQGSSFIVLETDEVYKRFASSTLVMMMRDSIFEQCAICGTDVRNCPWGDRVWRMKF
ncbi:hypothetical protein Tco_1314602 [Tanacetum coccineum]